MPFKRYISVIFSPDRGGQSFAVRIKMWQLWVVVAGVVIGWLLLFFGIMGAIFFARIAANQRALAAENSRLRLTLVKADSLRIELDKLREMRQFFERAILVEQKKEYGKTYAQQYMPSWFSKSSAFIPQKGLPELSEYLDNATRVRAFIPSGLPAYGIITARFGEVGGVFKEPHTGVDILLKAGSSVLTTADGIVAKSDRNEELGIFVEVDHLNGYRTVYAHLSEAVVTSGDILCKGDIIGYTGETGKVQHPHLHYEVLYAGKQIDPLTAGLEPMAETN